MMHTKPIDSLTVSNLSLLQRLSCWFSRRGGREDGIII